MKAVVSTDAFQALVMLASFLSIIIFVSLEFLL